MKWIHEVDAIRSGFVDSAALAKPKDKLETAKNIGFSTRVLSCGLRRQFTYVYISFFSFAPTMVLCKVLAWKS